MSDIHGVISTSTLIHTGIGMLTGLVASVDGTSDALVTCYDNTSASGTILFQAYIGPSDQNQPYQVFFSDRFAIRFTTGLYIAITGLGASVNYWGVGI